MLLKPLKRVPLPESSSSEMVEPSAGLAAAFGNRLRDFPKVDEDRIAGQYFSGLRLLICLHDGGKPFLPQLVNSLNESDPAKWNITVQEDVPLRQTLDDLDVAYLIRVVDYFLDALTVNQMEVMTQIIRTEIWPDKDTEKNS